MTVVAATGTGEEALKLFEAHRPDVTVLDLQLPAMTGFDLIRAIRSSNPAARIVVVTAYQGHEDIFAALQAGAASYLLKDSGISHNIQCSETRRAPQSDQRAGGQAPERAGRWQTGRQWRAR